MTQLSEADVAARWNDNADQWAHDVRQGYDTYRDLFTLPAFLAFLPSISGLDVIDFGCGEASNTRRFAAMGARMTGIDLSEQMIRHARAIEEQQPLGIHYAIKSYSQNTGFEDASFDAVVSTMALMDGPDFPAAMREAFRLLRPGGFIAFSILHPLFHYSRVAMAEGGRREGDGAGGVALFRSNRFRREMALWRPTERR
ncbi:class I SAM-dependent methyltransferase [Sinorhizobium meliloti]|uniref:class I SAM-dependent methyltransferase n=1 Tax=Rhizobium meliloti TaxID=382 RepID=UPI00398C9BE7